MAVYGELLGNGFIIASINFEYNFADKVEGFGIRTGISIVDPSYGQFTIPVLGHYLVGRRKHKLELGLGTLFITKAIVFNESNVYEGTSITASLMYRYHADSGFMLRLGITPIYSNSNFIPYWPGIGVGYRF